jgi:hypothetical protein
VEIGEDTSDNSCTFCPWVIVRRTLQGASDIIYRQEPGTIVTPFSIGYLFGGP